MTVDDLLAIPYEKNGRTLKGADCWGFTVIMERELFNNSLPLWDITEDFDVEKAKDSFMSVATPEDGDIVLMRTSASIAHAGVFFNSRIYHMAERGVCASNAKALRPIILGFYRVKH